MKYFISVLLVVGIYGCRTIEGDYDESFGAGWGGAHYHFLTDGTFDYESRYDVGGEYGSGRYRIRCGHLQFKFTEASTQPYTMASYSYSRRDSTDTTRNITLQFLDQNRDPIAFGLLVYQFNRDTVLRGLTTDLDGTALVYVSDSCDSIRIKFRYPGYAIFEKAISLSENKGLQVMLYSDPRWGMTPVDSGSVWKYGYMRVDSKMLRLTEHRVDEEETENHRIKRTRRKLTKILVRQ